MVEFQDEAFLSLLGGNEKFRETNLDFRDLAGSQHPEYVVISCSDSRVSPSIIFDAPIGSMFEIRVAGEALGINELASVQFAVEKLGTVKIIVVGHTGCGAVTAAWELMGGKAGAPDLVTPLSSLVEGIAVGLSKLPPEERTLENCINWNTKIQALELLGIESVRNLREQGKLCISTALYHVEDGRLELMGEV